MYEILHCVQNDNPLLETVYIPPNCHVDPPEAEKHLFANFTKNKSQSTLKTLPRAGHVQKGGAIFWTILLVPFLLKKRDKKHRFAYACAIVEGLWYYLVNLCGKATATYKCNSAKIQSRATVGESSCQGFQPTRQEYKPFNFSKSSGTSTDKLLYSVRAV